LAELYFGAFKSARVQDNFTAIDEFRRVVRVLNLDDHAAILFRKVKATLKREKNILADSDLFIAAIALSTRSVLVTNNARHFNRIDGLTLENWTVRSGG
jgi:predicted nucleic acid-binding protein